MAMNDHVQKKKSQCHCHHVMTMMNDHVQKTFLTTCHDVVTTTGVDKNFEQHNTTGSGSGSGSGTNMLEKKNLTTRHHVMTVMTMYKKRF